MRERCIGKRVRPPAALESWGGIERGREGKNGQSGSFRDGPISHIYEKARSAGQEREEGPAALAPARETGALSS